MNDINESRFRNRNRNRNRDTCCNQLSSANPVPFLLVQETIAFDTLFLVQHYVLYSERSPTSTYHAIDAEESKDGVGNNKGDA